MGPPSEKTNDLIKYLVQAFPNSLEYKSTLGETPLWLAFYFGRLDFVKTLIDAGANQMARNNHGNNIIHAALEGLPKARRLRPVLECVDSGIIAHLFQQRNSLHESGTTPLHTWITAVSNSRRNNGYYHHGAKYDRDEQILEVLGLLLGISQGSELEMLNGAGDTPLHTAVMSQDELLTRALLEHSPKPLFRENAVGRTPAEIARENVTAEKFATPDAVSLSFDSHNSNMDAAAFVDRPAWTFTKEGGDGSAAGLSAKQRVWEVVRAVLERHPDRRRLVSLSEANDVAKRLGDEYNTSRYFSITARQDEYADPEENEAKEDDKEDFAAKLRQNGSGDAWSFPDDDDEEKESRCPACGRNKAQRTEQRVFGRRPRQVARCPTCGAS